ncbi:MBL fold metallo-hydrolase [Paenibacillus pinihumi]|uniref:MBL fold metallo-hydrolase n=1 Tax=Paenibacillus pinihumi TaxID=669462 RepID=UPI0004189CE7|nr:MBL fold metallo-hydrolase [Paenibacillus pinihumi]
MKMIKHQFLYQLSFLPRIFPVNCYFVEEQDSLTLIDCALPYSAKAIMQAAETIGKPIGTIVLTHAHEDHVGSLDALKQALPQVPVYLSARDSRLLEGDLSLDTNEPQTPIRGSVATKLSTRPDVRLQDGDRIGSLLAIAAPGHTPGSMAFLDTRTQALVAGDALQIRGGVAVAGQLAPWFPFPAMATWNAEKALYSARKLAALGPSLLAVGHGSFLTNPGPVMNKAIRKAEIQLAKHHPEGGGNHVT